jgi:hypothetical protein
MKAQLKRGLLRALQACDGVPMPESALVSAARLLARPAQPTEGDILEALREVEAGGYAAGLSDELTQERSWMLTAKGAHKARGLGD